MNTKLCYTSPFYEQDFDNIALAKHTLTEIEIFTFWNSEHRITSLHNDPCWTLSYSEYFNCDLPLFFMIHLYTKLIVLSEAADCGVLDNISYHSIFYIHPSLKQFNIT